MHTIRCRNITHRRNSAGEWEETLESEYYLNEPEDGEIIYRIKGDTREPVVFRHGCNQPTTNLQATDKCNLIEQEVSTDYGKYTVRKEGDKYIKETYDTHGRLTETIRFSTNGDIRWLTYIDDGTIHEFRRERVD